VLAWQRLAHGTERSTLGPDRVTLDDRPFDKMLSADQPVSVSDRPFHNATHTQRLALVGDGRLDAPRRGERSVIPADTPVMEPR
jgi:hypothetical protein